MVCNPSCDLPRVDTKLKAAFLDITAAAVVPRVERRRPTGKEPTLADLRSLRQHSVGHGRRSHRHGESYFASRASSPGTPVNLQQFRTEGTRSDPGASHTLPEIKVAEPAKDDKPAKICYWGVTTEQADLNHCGPLSSPRCSKCVYDDNCKDMTADLGESIDTCMKHPNCTGVTRQCKKLDPICPGDPWQMRSGDWLQHSFNATTKRKLACGRWPQGHREPYNPLRNLTVVS